MKCSDCKYFDDYGHCRNPKSPKAFVGFFQEACGLIEPTEKSKTKNQEKMKENNTDPVVTGGPVVKAVCKDCGRELPIEEFQKNRWGYTCYCKECYKKRQKEGAPKPGGIAKTEPAGIAGSAHIETLDESLRKLDDNKIMRLLGLLADELRTRGYDVTGTITQKYEI